MSTPIAVAAALAAALLFGLSSVADQRSTKRVRTRRALSPAIMLDLVRQPLWLIAIAANVAAFALQVVALDFGSIAVVQPLLVFDLIFAIVIMRMVGRRQGIELPGARRILAGVLAAAAGVAGFLVIGQPSAGHSNVAFDVLVPLAAGLAVAVGGCLAVAARNENLRPLALAVATGVCYGVSAFAVKLVTSEFGAGPAHVFTNWPIYVLAVVGPAGFILNQDAFQQGTYLAPVQAIVTTSDPVISIGLGIVWLGVTLRSGPAAIVGVVGSLLLMTAGIVITARYAPSGQKARSSPGASGRSLAADRIGGRG
jgi:drug/metabolite transporter (DMT)-like permease